MKIASLLKTASTVALATAVSGPFANVAAAQDGSETAVARDVITVTATRREATVQDVPLNIAAVGGAEIEQQGLDELADLLAVVPGINVVDRGGRQGNPIIVRGLNAEGIGSGDGNNDGGGTVATYLGEIPLYIDLKLNDLERVEVLLGPQGTLYGAGTLGGAIRYIPKKPEFGSDLLAVRSEAFQYSHADSISSEFGFTVNKALGDRFAVRASVDYLDDSGFIDYPFVVQEVGVSNPDPDFADPSDVAANLTRVEDADSEETLSGRLAARFEPVDWLDGTLTYYYQRSSIGGRTVSSARSTVPAGQYEAGKRVEEPNEITNQLLAMELVADLGFAELTSATGASWFNDDGQRDQTDLLITLEYSYELFPSFASFTRELGREQRLNQELRLVSTHGGPIDWIVGGFYNRLRQVGSSSEFTPFYDTYAINELGFDFLVDRPDDLEYFSQQNAKTVEKAIFGEVGYDITSRWNVNVGGRVYDYEVEEFATQDFPLFDLGFVPPALDQIADTPFDPDLAQGDSGQLFKFNTSYLVTDDVLTYFTISEGYRIGGSNGVAPCPDFDPNTPDVQGACALAPGQEFFPGGPENASTRDERQFGPDTTTNYEAGVKTTWLDGDLTLNGAVYYIEWTDPQLTSATVNANIPITVNADGAESTGVELFAAWQATERFNLRGSFSQVKAELTADAPALVRTITPPGFGTAFEDGLDGDRLPGSPETQFAVFGSYEVPLNNGALLTFNGGYSHQGDVLTRAGGRGDSLTLDSYGIANASMSYQLGGLQAVLFANNLFDEYAETGATATSLFNQTVSGANVRSYYTHIAPPRSVGVRLAYEFGG